MSAPAARRWSAAEDERLRQAYAAGERIDLVAAELGRTLGAAVTRAAKYLKVSRPKSAGRGGFATEPDWTQAEDALVRASYGKVRVAAIAAELGRSVPGVYNRAFVLGLKAGYHRDWSDDERRALAVSHQRGLSLTDLAQALGRNFHAVAKFAKNHGYRFGKRPLRVEPLTLEQILALEDPAVPLPAAARQPAPTKFREPEDWPVERQEAWLHALERTGRIDEALKAIGLAPSSRKAAYRLKWRDPAFSRRWDEALRRSPYRPGRKPGLGPLAWDAPDRQDAFVAALLKHGQLRAATKEIGLVGNCARDLGAARRRNPDFDRRCIEALAAAAPARAAARKPERPRRPAREAPKLIRVWDTPERREPFVAALRRHGTVGRALLELGLGAGSTGEYCRARKRDAAFAARCDAAIAEAHRPKAEAPAPRARAAERPAPPPPPSAPTAGSRRELGTDGIDWEAARRVQRVRRAAATKLANGAKGLSLKEGGPGLFFIARAAHEAAETQRRMGDSVEQAKLYLQRRGRIVYRASVTGGRADRWFVSGLGKEVTDDELIAEAARRAAA